MVDVQSGPKVTNHVLYALGTLYPYTMGSEFWPSLYFPKGSCILCRQIDFIRKLQFELVSQKRTRSQ